MEVHRADVIAEQVRGIVIEAIYEARLDERTPREIADDMALVVRRIVADQLEAALREQSSHCSPRQRHSTNEGEDR